MQYLKPLPKIKRVETSFLMLFFFFLLLVSHSAIDLLYGGIYCFVCQDYIYDKDMEQIAKEEQRKAWKLQGNDFCKSLMLAFGLHNALWLS